MRLRRNFLGVLLVGSACIVAGSLMPNVALFFAGLALWFTSVPSLLDLVVKHGILGGARVERVLERTKIFADEPLRGRVNLRSAGFPLDVVEVEDPCSPALGEGNGGVLLPLGTRSFAYAKRLRRGRYVLGPIKFYLRDRSEYFEGERAFAGEQPITVYPTYEDVRKAGLAGKSRQLGKLYGVHQTRQKGVGSEFHGIRLYVPSDEYRRIAWKQFARYARLMSKEYEGEKNISILLCLDSSWTMGGGRDPVTKLEYAVRAALLLAKTAEERGDTCGLALFSDSVRRYLRPSKGKRQFHELLEVLTDTKAEGEKSYSALAEYVCKVSRRFMLVLLLTDLEGDFGDLKSAIQKLKGRGHEVLVVCPFTPRFEIEPLPDPALHAVASVLLERMETDHRKFDKELEKLGVDCIKVGPADFLPTAVEKVLEKKKLGVALV